MTKRPTGIVPIDVLKSYDGLDVLKQIVDGRLPIPPIAELVGFTLGEVEEGRVVFSAVPEFRHYNPIGSVHGGFAATLLDSCMGCAVHSTLKAGTGYTTLEFKVNLVRGLTDKTGEVFAEGRVVHVGRQTATAEGTIKDKNGRVYAHASTTCLLFPL